VGAERAGSVSLAIELRDVSRSFGSVDAVAGVSLAIEDGEFFSMLGPSGSGKTTCLRLIAGFDTPTRGQVLLAGADASSLPPYERDVNTVFQDYALFPHLSVLDNIAYGLRMKGVASAERQRRATAALEQVALGGMAERRPSQLSGGQRQRVALARALVNRPRVLLLDEPLGALDLKLREQMQLELKTLHRELGITFVYVTHDQGEALSMSDRVAVFNRGRLEQVAAPRVLYDSPRTVFVAGFVGTANVLRASVAQRWTGRERAVAIRPEDIRLSASSGDGVTAAEGAGGEARLDGTIVDIQFQGASSRLVLDTAVGPFSVSVANDAVARSGRAGLERGSRVALSWAASAMVELDAAEPV
jgi:putative spermidine/putrescine transport system ATP-binding protein